MLKNTPHSHPLISVGIVTYNNQSVIKDAIESLCSSNWPLDRLQIIVIDNRSTDDTLKIIEEFVDLYPQVQLTHSGGNVGFGRGHNTALPLLTSDFHVVCNPDIIVQPDTLKEMVEFLAKNPDIGVSSPKILNTDGSLQTGNKRLPTVLDLCLRRFLPKFLVPLFQKRLDRYVMKDVGYDHTQEVPCLSGAFLVFRTNVFKDIQGFDERYFMYFEDNDICRKVRLQKLRTVYFPGAVATHAWERAAHKSIKMALILAVNGLRYFRKWGWKLT